MHLKDYMDPTVNLFPGLKRSAVEVKYLILPWSNGLSATSLYLSVKHETTEMEFPAQISLHHTHTSPLSRNKENGGNGSDPEIPADAREKGMGSTMQ